MTPHIQSHAEDCAEILVEKQARGEISRRDIMLALAALGVAPALGAGPAFAAVPDVTVANSGGASLKAQQETWGAFYEKETGGKVNWDGSQPSNGKIRAMVEAKNVIWDVCDLGPQAVGELGPIGMLSKIDYSIVDKTKCIPQFAYEYGICNYLFSHVLAWDTKVVTSQPTLADYYDVKKYPGKRGIRKDPVAVFEAALQADGVPKDKLYPLDVDRALKKIASIKNDAIFWGDHSQSQSLIRDGEIVMGIMSHTRAILVKEETKGRVNWSFRGGFLIPSIWVVPANNPSGKQVMHFIRASQEPSTQIALMKILGNGPANPEADKLVPPELQAANPGSAVNVEQQVKMGTEYWMQNYGDNLKKYLDMIQS
jgi:putative spermidine/putrescine transport system substrate-binding protein